MPFLSDVFSAFMAMFCAFLLGLFAIPKIIYVAKKKRLVDRPDHRKIHTRIIPNLGGIGIFFAFIIVASLFIHPKEFPNWTYISAATLVLFVTGVKDDLVGISPKSKLLAQGLAASITVFFADIRISSFHGLLGIYELPVWFSQLFTIVGCAFVSNAFNLIDGIDGLAGSISFLACMVLGTVLFMSGFTSEACVAFSLSGAIGGFLWYNRPPARIFMGDTGSLIIGFMMAILCIMMTENISKNAAPNQLVHTPAGTLILSLAVLFIPLFDTFRVFATRAMKGQSPFKPDRTHLHHYLLDLGFSHGKAVIVLLICNLFILIAAYLLQDINPHFAIITMIVMAVGLFLLLFYLRHKKLDPHTRPISKLIPRRDS